jgi:hypothetical protein
MLIVRGMIQQRRRPLWEINVLLVGLRERKFCGVAIASPRITVR